jgi:hypothetical protein
LDGLARAAGNCLIADGCKPALDRADFALQRIALTLFASKSR